MEHSTSYKGTREEKQKLKEKDTNNNIGTIIKWTYQNLIPSDKVIRVAKTEADDGIAVAVAYEKLLNSKIIIISGDSDLLQLCDNNVLMMNPKSNSTMDISKIEMKFGKTKIEMSGDVYRKTKILAGDKTDEIEPVFIGCGPNKAYELALSPEKFDLEITQIPERLLNYERNKKLISLDQIPPELHKELEKQYLLIKDSYNGSIRSISSIGSTSEMLTKTSSSTTSGSNISVSVSVTATTTSDKPSETNVKVKTKPILRIVKKVPVILENNTL
jgi:hypothetical protein